MEGELLDQQTNEQQKLEHLSTSDGAAIMIYFRPEEETVTALDRTVSEIAERYRQDLHVVRVDTRPGVGETKLPIVRLLRAGTVVGEALGPHLPLREVDRVVQAALR